MQHQLRGLPPGKLICTRNEKRYKWFQSDGHQWQYIPKKNRAFAEQLAIKKYLTLQLDRMEKEKKAIDAYLRHHDTSEDPATLLIAESGYRELLQPYFRPISQKMDEWMKADYKSNPYHPEQLIHKGSSGCFMRSKSEVMIETFLHINKIPFRYECELCLGDSIVYPDFTIRHPKTGDTFYWEHFGLMDQPVYIKKACEKLQQYSLQGILPTVQLNITCETKEYPLNTDRIKEIIQQYFM